MSLAPSLRYASAPKRLQLALAWREAATFALLHLASLVLGFGLLVMFFKAGLLATMSVLFYRGLVLIGVSGLATLALLITAIVRFRIALLRPRDAISAAMVSLAFNLCFFVLLPVTVDRSISVFVLGEMTAHADRTYSTEDVSRLFTTVYVAQDRQIERRLHEQVLSGNVQDVGGRYRITPRGAGFISLSRAIAWMFDSDTRFVTPAKDAAARSTAVDR